MDFCQIRLNDGDTFDLECRCPIRFSCDKFKTSCYVDIKGLTLLSSCKSFRFRKNLAPEENSSTVKPQSNC